GPYQARPREAPVVEHREEEKPEPAAATPPPAPAEPSIVGRIIVMDESALRSGDLGAIREYQIGSGPLTLGTGPGCDVVTGDSEGRIGEEEARLWVQRNRLVYHKLTTLSAMATEGVTSGWLFLEDGDEIQVGPYRVSFLLTGEEELEPTDRGPEDQAPR